MLTPTSSGLMACFLPNCSRDQIPRERRRREVARGGCGIPHRPIIPIRGVAVRFPLLFCSDSACKTEVSASVRERRDRPARFADRRVSTRSLRRRRSISRVQDSSTPVPSPIWNRATFSRASKVRRSHVLRRAIYRKVWTNMEAAAGDCLDRQYPRSKHAKSPRADYDSITRLKFP
jgi:hypothetical protein